MAYNSVHAIKNPFKKSTAHVSVEKYKFSDKKRSSDKCKNEIVQKAKHNFRLDDMRPMYAEPTKINGYQLGTEYNEILIDSQKYEVTTPKGEPLYGEDGELIMNYDFIREIDERIKSKNIKPKVGANAALGLVLEVTDGWEHLPENFDLEQWKRESIEWLEQKFGKENVLSAVVHMDEYTPHIHAIVTPITPDGRLSSRDWLQREQDYSDIQKEYYEAVKQDGIQACQSKMKMPFMGKDSQRKAQNALNAAGEIEIVPERLPGENDREYQERVNEQCQTFSMQKHLELEDMYRSMQAQLQAQVAEIQAQKEAAENEVEEEKKRRNFYKDKYEEEKKNNEFYIKQLSSTGLPRQALRDAATLTAALEEQKREELRALSIKSTRLTERNEALQKENNELVKKNKEMLNKLNSYEAAMDANGVTQIMKTYYRNMDTMLYALENGYPEAEQFKKDMLKVLKFGKGVKDRDKSR